MDVEPLQFSVAVSSRAQVGGQVNPKLYSHEKYPIFVLLRAQNGPPQKIYTASLRTTEGQRQKKVVPKTTNLTTNHINNYVRNL